jgi:hypothetical protein
LIESVGVVSGNGGGVDGANAEPGTTGVVVGVAMGVGTGVTNVAPGCTGVVTGPTGTEVCASTVEVPRVRAAIHGRAGRIA